MTVHGESLRRLDAGRRVVTLREALLRAGVSLSYLAPDSVNDPSIFDDHVDAAVRAFQQSRGLIVDGVAGPDTQRALQEAQFRFGDRTLSYVEDAQLRGDDVAELQRHLSHLGFYYGHIDGSFGVRTRYAVAELQQNLGLPGSGVCDGDTMTAMSRVNRAISPSQAFALRDYERLDRSTAALRGRLISVNIGRSRKVSPHVKERLTGDPLTEVLITTDIAGRVERILREFGARLVPQAADAGAGSRSTSPSLNLDIHCDWLDQQAASGIAAYYWGLPGTGEARSPIGHRAAVLLMKELGARTDMDNLGVHARTWDTLKLPGVPSVGLDLGYLSNAHDAERLADPVFRQTVADSIVIGIQRLYLMEEEDQPTGTLALDDVLRFNPMEEPARRVSGL
ncbi:MULTISPECIES: peptidoglycan-binding protein [unclassified Arthrobacter]|uniref:peptidoglycan-binding protein n=1 Tax=unclassified Arthrobacter TaxID=235627 RepID=UPI001D1592DF|nr:MULTISPECIES: peptidoglycan-binding protein [unclassified Arthrobacter]MCC3275606.1 peptidoglycan-binding protein [Arthrobacter sp. zg-Y20]MCC3278679.1 peptidoglycan-binding protein [Arthrobacter sp. zg-Y40]MCC9177046.1 peptidoglycan-binding protein [Arthrobacter sp. zg-Y750]MDK1315763.1 peptidoglycan-binding protein [Arthrobacter sp. zg.Y20]MDK1326243.1 peptidoglycan-binding protein [Arthrobacter sp. zg-Y1143]